MPQRYPGCPGSVGGDDLGENGGVWRMGLTQLFWLGSANARDEPFEPLCAKHHRSRPVCRHLSNPGVPDICAACCACIVQVTTNCTCIRNLDVHVGGEMQMVIFTTTLRGTKDTAVENICICAPVRRFQVFRSCYDPD